MGDTSHGGGDVTGKRHQPTKAVLTLGPNMMQRITACEAVLAQMQKLRPDVEPQLRARFEREYAALEKATADLRDAAELTRLLRPYLYGLNMSLADAMVGMLPADAQRARAILGRIGRIRPEPMLPRRDEFKRFDRDRIQGNRWIRTDFG